MPLYEYQCDACAHRFERIQKYSDPLVDVCPTCGGHVRKLLSSPAIQFKGTGFYITDYPKKSASDAGKGEAAEGGGEVRPTVQVVRLEVVRLDIVRPRPRPDPSRSRTSTVVDSEAESKSDEVASPRPNRNSAAPRGYLAEWSAEDRCRAGSPRTSRRDRAAAARSRRPPSGSPACCRCRGGRRRCGSRRPAGP